MNAISKKPDYAFGWRMLMEFEQGSSEASVEGPLEDSSNEVPI